MKYFIFILLVNLVGCGMGVGEKKITTETYYKLCEEIEKEWATTDWLTEEECRTMPIGVGEMEEPVDRLILLVKGLVLSEKDDEQVLGKKIIPVLTARDFNGRNPSFKEMTLGITGLIHYYQENQTEEKRTALSNIFDSVKAPFTKDSVIFFAYFYSVMTACYLPESEKTIYYSCNKEAVSLIVTEFPNWIKDNVMMRAHSGCAFSATRHGLSKEFQNNLVNLCITEEFTDPTIYSNEDNKFYMYDFFNSILGFRDEESVANVEAYCAKEMILTFENCHKNGYVAVNEEKLKLDWSFDPILPYEEFVDQAYEAYVEEARTKE